MDEFRVPTVQVPTELHCADGVVLRGIVFMPAQSAVHAGPMLPDEWVNSPPPFFPFKPEGSGSSILLNKQQLLAMVVEERPPTDELLEWEAAGPKVRVAVEADGKRFEGHLVMDMPENRRRVVDCLNRPEAFLSLTDGDRVILIRKTRISRSYELQES
jgi:hypothetical protein